MRRIIREDEPPRPSTAAEHPGRGGRSTVSANRGSEPTGGCAGLVRGRAGLGGDEGAWRRTATAGTRRPARFAAGRRAVPGRRAGAGLPAVGGVPAAEVRPAEQGPGGDGGGPWPWGCCWRSAAALAVQAAGDRADQGRAEADAGRERPTRCQALGREQWTLYFQRIALAGAGGGGEQRRPGRGTPRRVPVPLRGWEWHYLKRRCHQEPFTLRGSGGWLAAWRSARTGSTSPRGPRPAPGRNHVWDGGRARVHFTCRPTSARSARWPSAPTAGGWPRPRGTRRSRSGTSRPGSSSAP